MKKMISLLLIFAFFLPCAYAAGYPKKKVNGIIQWGAGGGTDSLMRPLCALAEKELGQKIALRNMAGGSGSIAAQYVHDQKADGYTLLLGAENPALYRVLGISELTYDDFDCVLLIGDETVGIAVAADSGFQSFSSLIEAALASPDTVTLATTGTGGLPWEIASILYSVTGARFRQIPYDSDASARVAVMNGECEFTVCKIQTGLEAWKSGDLRYLCLLSLEEDAVMPGVPSVIGEYPGFAEFLPWGPFYGVFVKKGTDEAIVSALSDAFLTAFRTEEYQGVLSGFHINPLGFTGVEAKAYIDVWSRSTVSALEACGALG